MKYQFHFCNIWILTCLNNNQENQNFELNYPRLELLYPPTFSPIPVKTFFSYTMPSASILWIMHVWPSMMWMLRYTQDIPARGLIIPEWTKWGFGRSPRTRAHSHLPLLNIHRQDRQREEDKVRGRLIHFSTLGALVLVCLTLCWGWCVRAARRGGVSESQQGHCLLLLLLLLLSHCTLVVTWGRVWRGTRGLKQTRERWMFLDVMKGDHTSIASKGQKYQSCCTLISQCIQVQFHKNEWWIFFCCLNNR